LTEKSNLKKFADVNNPDFLILMVCNKKAHDKEIYLIARVFVFQDPAAVIKNPQWLFKTNMRLWKDWRIGQHGLTRRARVWDYNVTLAREAYERGLMK